MKFNCNLCSKEFDTYQARNAHKAIHNIQHIDTVKKQQISRDQTHIQQINTNREEYCINPKKCIYCNNVLIYENRNKQTCNYSCAAKYRNSQRVKVSIDLICIGCGDNIVKNTIYPNKIDKFCRKCQAKKSYIKNTKPKVVCVVCGEFNCKNKICEYYYTGGRKTLEALGLNIQNLGTKQILTDIVKVLECIMQEYENGIISSSDLLEKYETGYATFLRLCRITNIIPKTHSEANKIAYDRGRQPGFNGKFKTKWHTTWMNTKVFLRSGDEIEYAEKFDKQQILYEVESKRFKYIGVDNKEYIYIPDFYIPNENKIVEIKGSYFYNKDKETVEKKLEAARVRGYNVELIVC